MIQTPVYMDNQATTRADPRVIDAMLPFFDTVYGNAGSESHAFGWAAKDAVETSRQTIAHAIGASPREIIFTSGATESNNLAIRGIAERPRQKGKHIITVATEHPAVLDPVKRLGRQGYEITLLPVVCNGREDSGRVELDALVSAIRDDTILVSIMLANNEIGVIQPLREIGAICKQHGVPFHSDATQAVGKIPVNVGDFQVDLLSLTAHKLYGPKGIGALYIRRGEPRIRLASLIDGGGQENGLRSGTLNIPGIVGFAKAVELCMNELDTEPDRLRTMRNRLFRELSASVPDTRLNGPSLDGDGPRLPGNLNVGFGNVDGEALMMSMSELAVSSGSACSSTNPEPSHVLRALGLSDDQVRSSLRFGLGRFNTEEEVTYAIQTVSEAVSRLRSLVS